MSKKEVKTVLVRVVDYATVSRAFRQAKPDDVWGLEYWKKMVHDFASHFETKNRNFDKLRFYRDCGMPRKERT